MAKSFSRAEVLSIADKFLKSGKSRSVAAKEAAN
jgi:hypothetical protein